MCRVVMLAFPDFMDALEEKRKTEGSESEDYLQLFIVIVFMVATAMIVLQIISRFRIRRMDSLEFSVMEYRQWMKCTSWMTDKTHDYANELDTFGDLSEFTSNLELDTDEMARIHKLKCRIADVVQEVEREGEEMDPTIGQIYANLSEIWKACVLAPLEREGNARESMVAARRVLREMKGFSRFWMQSVEHLIASRCAISAVPVVDVIQCAGDIAEKYSRREQSRIGYTIDGWAIVRANKGEIVTQVSGFVSMEKLDVTC